MPNFSYLLNYFQDGDKILLYARGKNGRDIYEYLKTQPQWEVVGFVDRNADKLTGLEVPVYRPDQLKTIPPEAYDKIVITVMSQDMGADVCRIIRESGVEEAKIVAPYTYIGPVSAVPAEDFVSSRQALQQEIGAFLAHGYGNLLYFDPLIQALKAKKKEREQLLPQLKEVSSGLSPLETVVFLCLLYCADLFDAELMERLLENILKIDDPALRQFLQGLFNDTSAMCFLHPEYLFPSFYRLRRQFLKNLCGMYDFHMKADRIRRSPDGRIRRICVLNHMLFGEKASPTQVSIQVSNMLSGFGYEVMVMPLDVYSYIPLETPIFRPIINVAFSGSKELEEYHREAYRPEVRLRYTDVPILQEKMQMQLDALAEFSPDLIVDMSDDFSILSYIYSQYFPTLFLPMRGYQSCSYFTYFAAGKRDTFKKINRIYGAVDERKLVEFLFCCTPLKAKAAYDRKMLSLAEDDFVFITVGGRLNMEMSEDFVDSICEKLMKEPNLKWLVVGSQNEYLTANYPGCLKEGKILYIPYEEDLMALYQICDAYVNPERSGGAVSIFWAMCSGLPVLLLSTYASEALPWIGFENTAGKTYGQMMEHALLLSRDHELYRKTSGRFRQRARDCMEQQSISLKNVILEIEKRIQLDKRKGSFR